MPPEARQWTEEQAARVADTLGRLRYGVEWGALRWEEQEGCKVWAGHVLTALTPVYEHPPADDRETEARAALRVVEELERRSRVPSGGYVDDVALACEEAATYLRHSYRDEFGRFPLGAEAREEKRDG